MTQIEMTQSDRERLKNYPMSFASRWLRCVVTEDQVALYKELVERKGRFGLIWEDSGKLAITVLSVLMWRALCWKVPSLLVAPTAKCAETWCGLLNAFLVCTDQLILQEFKPFRTPTHSGFWASESIPVLLSLGPEDDPTKMDLKRFDILFGDFNETPIETVDIICQQSNPENLLILPYSK